MTLTVFPDISSPFSTSSSTATTPISNANDVHVLTSSFDFAFLNLSRLLMRLETNLLSPSADLRQLRGSELQRGRVKRNVEYAHSLLIDLESNLPQIKPVDRRHELQMELTQKRQVLNSLRQKLADIATDEELRRRVSNGKMRARVTGVDAGTCTGIDRPTPEMAEDYLYTSSDEEDEEYEDLLGTLEGTESSSDGDSEGIRATTAPTATATATAGEKDGKEKQDDASQGEFSITTTATPPTETTGIPTPTQHMSTTATTTTSSTLRNRHHQQQPSQPTTEPQPIPEPPQDKEKILTTHRNEQESLTTSLISLASQLKTSAQTFHSTLDSEKSVIDRAVEGLDRTTSSMASAEKRMGMLRRMTEGRGLWGRLMLYACIFGLWLVALGIVFLGPKIR